DAGYFTRWNGWELRKKTAISKSLGTY
ncbi:MAG: hypothetical protein QOF09_816, partial [Alphaproteobacteria bacterium]|nr:hypothetical protein [Alphaproteobacteria bacterium]